jgi:hypothetical protein
MGNFAEEAESKKMTTKKALPKRRPVHTTKIGI